MNDGTSCGSQQKCNVDHPINSIQPIKRIYCRINPIIQKQTDKNSKNFFYLVLGNFPIALNRTQYDNKKLKFYLFFMNSRD